jgi:riboflavin kinase/FMN adenylyltransferase
MEVHHNIDNLPVFKKAVITIGTFDGVHKGHQQIIDAVQKEKQRVKGESVIITFHPHPRKIVQPETSLQLINTLEEKIGLLAKREIDHLVIVPFSSGFAELTAQEYIENFLIRHFRPATIIIGYDHHFGKERKGNYALLEQERKKWHYELLEIPKHVLHQIDISSTKIRQALMNSEVDKANQLLGYPFQFEGKVVKGDQIGRTIGFPTANLAYIDPDKIHIGEGVYAVSVTINSRNFKGMLSIGKRPTLNDTQERVEVNIFDFDDEIYDQLVTVMVHHFIRPQYKYDNLHLLTEQIEKDKISTLAWFG